MVLNIHVHSSKGLSTFIYKGWYCVFFVLAIGVVFSGCAPEQEQSPEEHNHTEKVSTAQNNSDTNSLTPAENVPRATNSKPDTPTPAQKPIITLTLPTLAQTTKAYTGTPTAFTYAQILALVAPGNTAALSIDSVTRVADNPDILTPNPDAKTLTFTNTDALTTVGQQGDYTVTFSSHTHKVVPSRMDIPFVVKKTIMYLDSVMLTTKLQEDDENKEIVIWNKADIVNEIQSRFPIGFSNFGATAGQYGNSLIITPHDPKKNQDFNVIYNGAGSLQIPPIRFSFDAPEITAGYIVIKFEVESASIGP